MEMAWKMVLKYELWEIKETVISVKRSTCWLSGNGTGKKSKTLDVLKPE